MSRSTASAPRLAAALPGTALQQITEGLVLGASWVCMARGVSPGPERTRLLRLARTEIAGAVALATWAGRCELAGQVEPEGDGPASAAWILDHLARAAAALQVAGPRKRARPADERGAPRRLWWTRCHSRTTPRRSKRA